MLMLDHTTLFYFSLRDLDADLQAQLVHNWVRKVPSNVNPKSTCQNQPLLSPMDPLAVLMLPVDLVHTPCSTYQSP